MGAVDWEFKSLANGTPFDIAADVSDFDNAIERSLGSRKEPAIENSTPMIASHTWIDNWPPTHTGSSAASPWGFEQELFARRRALERIKTMEAHRVGQSISCVLVSLTPEVVVRLVELEWFNSSASLLLVDSPLLAIIAAK